MIGASLFGLAAATAAHASMSNTNVALNRRNIEESKIPGEFIVVFEKETALTAIDLHAPALQRAGAVIIETYDISDEFRGYAFKANSTDFADIAKATDAARELAAREDVMFIEQDQMMFASAPVENSREICSEQGDATWGLARTTVDSAADWSKDVIDYYYPGSAGDGITAYIIDSGVRADHEEFAGRIGEIFDAYPEGIEGTDTNGHGTHVAGTVAGKTYGIAKKATIATVKVLSADGSGSNAKVIAGVNWACAERAGKPIKKRVANMSLGGGKSNALNLAVKACVDLGMPFIVAAGNDYADSCNYSPASEESAITVMASTIDDGFASFSNYGGCANIIAPGQDILSAYILSPTSAAKLSGTSMASPHVCGVAALIKASNPDLSPSEVLEEMVKAGEDGSIKRVPSNKSPNVLLHSACV